MLIYHHHIDTAHIIGIGPLMKLQNQHTGYQHEFQFSYSVLLTHYPLEMKTRYLDANDDKDQEEYKKFHAEYLKVKEVIEAFTKQVPVLKRQPSKTTKKAVVV